MDQAQLLRPLPVDSVAKTFPRHRLRELVEIVLHDDGLSRGMTAIASRHILFFRHLRTGGKYCTAFGDHASVMTCAAEVSLSVVSGFDVARARLHGEADIHVANAAGEHRTMDPVVKYNWRHRRAFRI